MRGRGGSAEKEGKPRSGPHRASTGKQLCRLIKKYRISISVGTTLKIWRNLVNFLLRAVFKYLYRFF